MSSDYLCISLLDMIKTLGESCVSSMLSSFSCPKNHDVEDFLKRKAIVFSRQGLSVTHLVFRETPEKLVLVGYFCLAPKQIVIKKETLNSKRKQQIRKFAAIPEHDTEYSVSALLIGQLGKNFTNGYNKLITGNDLLAIAFDKIKAVQQQIGGRLTYIECEDERRLTSFYRNNGFTYFDKRELECDETDNFKGKYLIQMFKYISM